jgi:hypothetical protein
MVDVRLCRGLQDAFDSGPEPPAERVDRGSVALVGGPDVVS